MDDISKKSKEELIEDVKFLLAKNTELEKAHAKLNHIEDKLRESEAQKNAILNGISINIALVDRELKILWANKAAADSVNKIPEEMIGKFCYSFWGNSVNPCENCPTISAIKTGRSEHKIVYTPDGRIWNESGEPILDAKGNVVAVVEIAQDITAQKKIEIDLHKNKEIFSLFMKHSPIYAYIKEVTPTESRVLQASENYKDMIGVPGSAMTGKNMAELFPEEFAAKITADDWNVVSTGTILKLDEELNGRSYVSIKYPITHKEKKILAGYTIDVTNEKLLQQQLIQSEKLSAVGQLAAGIAHEFNNVLAITQANVQVLEFTEKKLSEESIKILKIINSAIKRGAAIASNMMDFAKPRPPKKELFKLEDIMEDVLNLQKQQIILERIEIDRNYGHTEKVFIDVNQFQQVFLNMIINARHAILPKGQGKISISIKALKNNIEIKIADDGIGMDDESLKNMFVPFYSTKGAHAKDNYGIKGTGLGLAVSYTIVKNHNGTISVESKKNKGTVFTIKIPIPENKIEVIVQDIKEMANDEIANKNLKIMIIDDEKSFIKPISKILEFFNCSVLSATSGAAGLKIVKENKFDLIFLDMLLPDISGENIFHEIRKLDKEVPVIFISGQVGLEVEKLEKIGAYSFIQKPFDITSLKKILNDIRIRNN
ncbi:response regulator [Candidatus Dependentiae bacterium]|nr:response regulator [Candidatus Dependentiae bacterium]